MVTVKSFAENIAASLNAILQLTFGRVKGLLTPVAPDEAANKDYVDTHGGGSNFVEIEIEANIDIGNYMELYTGETVVPSYITIVRMYAHGSGYVSDEAVRYSPAAGVVEWWIGGSIEAGYIRIYNQSTVGGNILAKIGYKK